MYGRYRALSAPCPAKKWPPAMKVRVASTDPSIKLFLLKVTLWLPVAFGAWYYLSIMHVAPIAWLSDAGLAGLFPELFSGARQSGNLLEIDTVIDASVIGNAAATGGTIGFDINPLIFGYGLPLLTGLILASPGEIENKIFKIVGGGLILLPFQVWGVSFDALKTVYFGLGQGVAEQAYQGAGLPPDVVALGYQLGFLILPAVTPILVWIGMHPDFIRVLAPRLGTPPQENPS